FFSHRTHRSNGTFLVTRFEPSKIVALPNPSSAGRGVVCEVTPTGLLAYFVEVFCLSQNSQI
ncbi:hypothetical protein, partial [Prevotella sp. C561]|uniref:hypothetical protein n=1 Tax=Prevotella sp. C561 TaxID=563031 RepID=UPI001E49F66D